ncbi:ubiquitin-conjugating enzyme/RWD-like protein [Massariosphaeria phaeospora]|uniref:Ubiquitin-conjugating enzyme/RWD-like protein n=1 Tax=Massariosphaeria phaeospora TaxID=100035 RepID=A0A7C8I088_9PLEO|nr:ubiquitin-conjugating enzyme/RWD-like protein [Massariosphaeria phaeospora]
MSTRGQFNTKNPTIKRILKEASELASHASADYHAEPLEDNLFEWHFTLRGPPAPSAYEGGIYHGRIILPSTYPLRPPAFRFLTPTGRFEVNREICLSISGHHEETWQPAWGIRTAMVAIRSFMDTDAKGQLGGIECGPAARKKMAVESGAYTCGVCRKSNADIVRESKEAADLIEAKEGKQKEEAVPEELRLAYRDELGKPEGDETRTDPAPHPPPGNPPGGASASSIPAPAAVTTIPRPARTVPTPARQLVNQRDDGSIAWLDMCIYGIIAALLFMVVRKFA